MAQKKMPGVGLCRALLRRPKLQAQSLGLTDSGREAWLLNWEPGSSGARPRPASCALAGSSPCPVGGAPGPSQDVLSRREARAVEFLNQNTGLWAFGLG